MPRFGFIVKSENLSAKMRFVRCLHLRLFMQTNNPCRQDSQSYAKVYPNKQSKPDKYHHEERLIRAMSDMAIQQCDLEQTINWANFLPE